jgi:DNA polymerase-3 subunit epsilon
MSEFVDFIGDANLVAHNASFDKRFLDAELDLIGKGYGGEFACSLLVSRRLNQEANSHKLGDLVAYHNIANDGVFHRALADAEVTASLWLLLVNSLTENHAIAQPSFELMQKLAKQPKASVGKFLTKHK